MTKRLHGRKIKEKEKMGTKIKKIAQDTFMLTYTPMGVNQFLLVGEQKALLIDTGYGKGGLDKKLKKLTSLPIIAANSHLHPDHSNGNFLFESVFVGEADLPERGMPSNDLARGVADYYLHNSRIPKALIGKILKLGLMRPGQEKYLPLEDVVELGGRSVKVLPCPGHTPGSCLFLDENTASLFAGDAINGAFWAFTSPQTNLKEYAEVWESLKPRLQGVKRLWISHHRAPLDAGYIDAFIKALRTAGAGECKPAGIKGTPEQVNIYKVKDEKFGTLTFWAYPSQVR